MTMNTINDTVNTNTIIHTMSDKKSPYPGHKKWLCVTLAAAALTLSACGKNDTPPMETEPTADAQTSVEPAETGIASADASYDPMINDDVAVASANDDMASNDMMNDDVAFASADDGVAIDDSEILDGSEKEEHISTY